MTKSFNMKKILIALLLITSVGFTSYGQNKKYNAPVNKPFLDMKPVHWGFTFGINKTDFSIYKNSLFYNSDSLNFIGIESTSMPGIFLGPIFNVKLAKHFDLRFLLDISFTQRNFKYYIGLDSGSYDTEEIKIPSSFIEFPILLKYKGNRIDNFRPYVILGASGKYDLATMRKVNTNEPYLKVAPFDMYLEVGPGFDFYFPYFKFSVELKYSNGFLNVLDKTNNIYAQPIDALKSHAFMLSFHFEG